MSIFEETHDVNALNDAIAQERKAIEAWKGIVRVAGDFYNFDLRMGLPEFDLSGHWQDELVKLESGLAVLERRRAEFHPEPRRVVGRYDLGTGPVLPGYERVTRGKSSMFERNGSNLMALGLPVGATRLRSGFATRAKSHGPMWIEVRRHRIQRCLHGPRGKNWGNARLETSAVNGKVKILFDNATSADWHASSVTIARVDPIIATCRYAAWRPLRMLCSEPR